MELENNFCIPTNKYQTEITKSFLDTLPEEVAEQLIDCCLNIDYVKNLISPNRRRAIDMPHDEQGRVIVDFENPHILENMDYFRQAALFFKQNGCYTFLRPNPNPNSEYKKWITEEKRRCREGYVRESDGEWVTGYMYWFINYCPIMLTDITEGKKSANRIEDFPEIWEGIYLRFHYIQRARDNGHHAIELARRGAHPYFQKVFTTEGWKKWEDIKIGDSLYSSNNTVCKVTNIPYDKEAPYYKITLRDGREIYATDDHLWNIVNKGKEVTVNTLWLLQHYKHSRKKSYRIPNGIEYNCFIRKNEGIEMPHRITNVEPYTFGLLLGDGCFRTASCYYTQIPTDMETEKQFIPYNIVKWKDKYAYKIDIPNWNSIKKEYGLDSVKSEDKFIPDEYKYNSREVRLKLLKGLLDSDGYIHGGVPVLTSTSKKLIDDVSFISRSLGYNTNFVKKKAGYKKDGIYKKCLDSYELSIYAGPEVFNLHRKQVNVKYNSSNAKSRRDKTCIVNIEYIGTAPCKCVTVDSEDSCYLIGDFVKTHNCGKSYSLASMMSHNFVLGESKEVTKRVTTILTGYSKEYLADKDGTLSKFEPMINFVAENTEFPRLRLRNSSQEMFWQMGYVDDAGRKKGSLNNVMGVAVATEIKKLRGKRGHIYFEEMGSFPNLLDVYDTVRHGMEEGNYTYGLAYLVGTAAEKDSDFESAKTLLYHTNGYNIQGINNVYDRTKQGGTTFGYFFPAFLNRKGCYNKDGVSDVVKALVEILKVRHEAKYGTDPNSVFRIIAEMPITPAEAIIKVKNAYFPITALTERTHQLDTDSKAYDDILIGKLIEDKESVKFIPTNDTPIRKYKVDNDTPGALEIYEPPQRDINGKVFTNRYILGLDPVNNDQAESTSLMSVFVLDLWTDRIAAEYTGRQQFADDGYEIVRLLCLFYNGKCLYENNIKGPYAYFQKMQCTHLLADTPEYLRDKQLIKCSSFGSSSKGVTATAPINNYANQLIRDWLLKPVPIIVKEGDTEIQKNIANLYFIRSRALLAELIEFDAVRNFDRVRALGMVMLYREEQVILYGPSLREDNKVKKSYLGNDDYFSRNYNTQN